MAGVMVGPGNVHAGSAANVNFYRQRFFSRINIYGHVL